MARTEYERTTEQGAAEGDGRGMVVFTATEARRSFLTTEFWLSLAMTTAVIVAGYVEDFDLSPQVAWALGVGMMAIYVLSRGLAKAGSHDPTMKQVDEDAFRGMARR